MPKQKIQWPKKKKKIKKTNELNDDSSSHNLERIFVIQKHKASSLHYDFRLQSDDVLISWAVPKGLSTTANEKRLAIRTEDHLLDYAQFEGVIPKGEYGSGTVLVWDIGSYEWIHQDEKKYSSMKEALEGGSLKIRLYGKKLKGGYALVRINEENNIEQWIIFKLADEYADAGRNPVNTEPDSVLSGRSLEDITKEESNGH